MDPKESLAADLCFAEDHVHRRRSSADSETFFVSQKYIILHAVPFEKGNGLSREALKEVASEKCK